jgi:glycosyltransferase involved in cell wall biosynthesis
MANIKVLMITFNRCAYTDLSLKCLCESAPQNLKLTIWDNGSGQETKEVIGKFKDHPSVERVIFSERNEKLRKPTIWFWENNQDAELLGKVDDDCLVPKNWCHVLEQAHRDIPEAGILGCWHFLPEDFIHEKVIKKIATFGNHKIMKNCWVGGSGYLMKREVVNKIGCLKEKETFTDYCIRAAAKGFINGWYYPFLYQEHMDDPRAVNSGIKSEEDFQRLIPLSAQNFDVKTREQWIRHLKMSAQRMQECSIDPIDYIGYRALIKRKYFQVIGRQYFPRIK